MNRFRAAVAGLALVLGMAGANAAAQEAKEQPNPAGKPILHRATGISVPASLAGQPRTKVTAWAGESDQAFSFRSGDSEVLTVYIFRTRAGSLPLWFDRAALAIEQGAAWKQPKAASPAEPFTAAGQSPDAGLIEVWAPELPGVKSTGLAVLPLGRQWMVKLRATSATRGPAELKRWMVEVLGELGWPGKIPASPAAQPVADCTGALESDASAQPIGLTREELRAALAEQAAQLTRAGEEDAPVYCRDAGATKLGVLYRPTGARGYLVSMNDNGRAVLLEPDRVSSAAAKAKAPFIMAGVAPDQIDLFSPMDGLPAPAELPRLFQGDSLATVKGGQVRTNLDQPSSR